MAGTDHSLRFCRSRREPDFDLVRSFSRCRPMPPSGATVPSQIRTQFTHR